MYVYFFSLEFCDYLIFQPLLPEEPPILPRDEDEIEETVEVSPAINAYVADGQEHVNKPPIYSPELGLAVEQLTEGFTIQSLWEVLLTN